MLGTTSAGEGNFEELEVQCHVIATLKNKKKKLDQDKQSTVDLFTRQSGLEITIDQLDVSLGCYLHQEVTCSTHLS